MGKSRRIKQQNREEEILFLFMCMVCSLQTSSHCIIIIERNSERNEKRNEKKGQKYGNLHLHSRSLSQNSVWKNLSLSRKKRTEVALSLFINNNNYYYWKFESRESNVRVSNQVNIPTSDRIKDTNKTKQNIRSLMHFKYLRSIVWVHIMFFHSVAVHFSLVYSAFVVWECM